MKVRPAKFSDSAEIVEIWNPYIKETFVTFNASEKTQEEVCELIKDRRDNGHEFWVASQDDKIIGFASYDQLRGGVGYRYSMEHTIIQLFLESLTTSISNSFHPATDFSINICLVGLALKPLSHNSINSASV